MVRHDALTLGTATNPAAAAWRTPVRGVRVIAPFVEVEQALRPGAQTQTLRRARHPLMPSRSETTPNADFKSDSAACADLLFARSCSAP